MPRLRILNTVERSFGFIRKDPTLVVLFVLPALFQADRAVLAYLIAFVVFHVPGVSGAPPMHYVAYLVVYVSGGILFGAWASAAAILKVTELEKGSKLGLGEALSRGLRKVPRLLLPFIVTLLIATLMSLSLFIAIAGFPFISMYPLVESVVSCDIGPRLALGLLFLIVLYVAIRLRLYAPACVLEHSFGLKTSWKLVRGNWWRIFAIISIFGAMAAIIGLIPGAGVFIADLIVGPLVITAVTLVYLQLTEAGLGEEEQKQPS